VSHGGLARLGGLRQEEERDHDRGHEGEGPQNVEVGQRRGLLDKLAVEAREGPPRRVGRRQALVDEGVRQRDKVLVKRASRIDADLTVIRRLSATLNPMVMWRSRQSEQRAMTRLRNKVVRVQ
jgi:hypothetical protein